MEFLEGEADSYGDDCSSSHEHHDHEPGMDCEVVKVEAVNSVSRPRRLLRNKALWVNTWMLVTLAATHRHLFSDSTGTTEALNVKAQRPQRTATATAAHPEVDPQGNDLTISEEEETTDLENYYYTSPQRTPTEQETSEEEEGVILVTTVDGTYAGLSRTNGKVLWRQSGQPARKDTNSMKANLDSDDGFGRLLNPLVSTTTTTKSNDHDWRTAAVPSIDGRVFLTSSGNELEEVPTTSSVKDLVEKAPFVDSRGRFYVGNRHATAAAMDKHTGEILRVVPNAGKDLDASLEDRSVVWIGRIDYSISLFDARSGDMDVRFSSSEVVGVKDMMGEASPAASPGVQQHAPRLMLPNSNVHEESSFGQPDKISVLVSTPSGNVAFRNPDTGRIEWVSNETFDTPIAFAVESSTGTSLGVDIFPDAPNPKASPEFLASDLERHMEALDYVQGDGQTIVGALSTGQLFAMPLGKKPKMHIPLGLPQSVSQSSIHGSNSKLQVPNLSNRHHVLQESIHHADHGRSTILARHVCNSNSPGFPSCLVGRVHSNADLYGALAGRSFLDHTVGGASALAIQYHDQDIHQEDLNYQFRQKKKTFSKLMASWLPPTMALIFVLSFQLGRRQQQKRKGDKPTNLDITSSSSFDVSSDGVRNVGVIQMTDEVLGFGGHGTVVYRGTLDGRRVAVKRMLKAYHASADREISLLIESDGHPNVVRYFMKEAKGDFVYLALELCDLSLHDLIGTLRQHQGSSFGEMASIREATKSTLFHIASGVRHLHQLRIVHRDLKPANILLAKTARKSKRRGKEDEDQEALDVFSVFKRGDFTAKISDMGLGKQLTGQSSFGLSTHGQSSLQVPTEGESSQMTGAGPGSVGWQAPEVMKVRWSSETASVRSDASSRGGPDSLTDVSPLDANTSCRTSRSVDVFSLGCIFHSTLVPGVHPFGDWYEREANIMKHKPSIETLEAISAEAHDLVSSMIQREPRARPTASEICEHPFFWSNQRKLAFICDVSDRIELEAQLLEDGKKPSSEFGANVMAIEGNAGEVVGTAWDRDLDEDLVSNVSKFRTYDPSSVRDCLRLIRNKHHHYDELPQGLKDRIGSNSDGMMAYFEQKFPKLLMHCYEICRRFIDKQDALAVKYCMSLSIQRHRLGGERTRDFSGDTVVGESCTIGTTKPHERHTDTPDMIVETSEEEQPAFPSELPNKDDEAAATETEAQSAELAKTENEATPLVHETLVRESPAQQAHQLQGAKDIVVWEGSNAAKTFKCRGWMRSDDEWSRRTDSSLRKRDSNVSRCMTDGKFRTRLCNHWDVSLGTFCPMRKRNKCVFAHGPVELRVKEGKKNRWGRLVDKEGNNSNPNHSGGEDTYGAARSIETMRKEEGKWNTDRRTSANGKQKPKGGRPNGRKTPQKRAE